jgi:GntR family transcriptional regulator/MocR family aminotransferase
MARRKALLNHGCPWLEQAVLARLFEYGDYSRHLYKLRRRYRAQRDALLAGLRSIWGDDCQISGASTGMHLALHLRPTAHPLTRSFSAHWPTASAYPLPEAACGNASEKTDRVVLFGYASLTTRQIGEAMSLLKSVLTARFRRAVAEPATARAITSVASPC